MVVIQLQQPRLEVPNALLNYELYPLVPNPSNPFLICIHGGNGSLEDFRALGPVLGATNKVNAIIYDRRSYSRSALTGPQDYVTPGARLARDADDVLALIKHLCPTGKAYVLGNSLGSIVSLMVQERHPEAVIKLLAHEPVALSFLPDREEWRVKQQAIYDAYRAQGILAGLMLFGAMVRVDHDTSFKFNPPGDEVLADPYFVGNVLEMLEREMMMYPFQEFDVDKMKQRAQEGKLVLLCGRGTHPTTPQFLPNFEIAKLCGIEVTMIDGGHVAFRAAPERFTEELLALLDL
jgi:acetyltransferase/esterase